jgi:hypothetical protein
LPHQCLNCGHVIERGSDEILKGCSRCGGKKFMFTSQPMSEEARKNLKRKADKVRDKMIKKADPELLKILKDRGMTELDGDSLEMDESLGDEWVKYTPGEEEEEKIELDEGRSRTGVEIVEGGRKPSAKDLIKEYDRKLEKKVDKRKLRRGKRKVKKEAPIPKKKATAAPRKRATKPGVDVINIVEQGVYEIDVEKLLEDNPIIIQKDGSYLLHLPSLFKEGREKKK